MTTQNDDSPTAVPDNSGENPADISGVEIIRKHLKTLTGSPGVYRMLGAEGEVLYVGKARNLINRVTSYTRLSGHSNRIARMISLTRSMEFVVTDTDTEAVLLEANLIKRLKPHFNILLRDDKSFPYIVMRQDHPFPRGTKHRGARAAKGEYFGPFASAGAVNRTLNALQKAFLIRSCTDSIFSSRTRPCLLFQIKRCAGPCVDRISEDDYSVLVDQALDFLKGNSSAAQEDLAVKMEAASTARDYEAAAVYRDRIKALTQIQARQDINPRHVAEADVIAAYQEGGQTSVQVFFFRAHQNWGNRAYFPRAAKDQPVEEVLEAFIGQFYDNKPAPRLILLSHAIAGQTLLGEALSVRAGHKIAVHVPERGEKRALVLHAAQNARQALARKLAESASQKSLLDGLAQILDLDASPTRLEVYDNSHIQGTNAVGGMIVAGPDGFEKNQYRKFNIKSETITPGDDYGMMTEVLTRRFTRLMKEDEERAKGMWPEVIIIDGGKGQLSAAEGALADVGADGVTILAIAKGPDRNAGREQFFMAGRPPFMLEPKTPVLHFLQRLRDEAHRYAIGTHRARRAKSAIKNPLDDIPGIGAARKRALLHHFGSARAVSEAGLTDLENANGISKTVASRVYYYFHDKA